MLTVLLLAAEVRQQSMVFSNNSAIVPNDRLTALSQNAHKYTRSQSLTTQKCITSAHTITKHTDHPRAHLVSKTRSLTLQTHSLTHTYTLENPDREHLE